MTPDDIATSALEVERAAHSKYTELLRDADDVDAAISAVLASGDDPARIRVAVGLHDAQRGLAAERGEDARRVSTVEAAWRALKTEALDEAERLGADLIAGRREDADPFAVADGVHNGNIVCGHVALRRGDSAAAARHLVAAADVEGSAVLRSFGPDLSLAWALLNTDEESASLEYFRTCARFWTAKGRF